jgi:3-hydroxybutyryl-CoA dehydrogenase
MAPEGADAAVLEPARNVLEAHGLATLTLPDRAGGVAFRLVALLANEAASALAEGLADAPAIDTAMRLGTRYPHGPLAWASELGLADLHAALRGLQHEIGAERFAPQPLLTRLAAMRAERFPERTGAGT